MNHKTGCFCVLCMRHDEVLQLRKKLKAAQKRLHATIADLNKAQPPTHADMGKVIDAQASV